MELYTFTLVLGGAGFGAMALSGLGSRAHRGGAHRTGHRGAHRGAGKHHAAARAGGGRHHHHGHLRDAASRAVWALLSPRTAFGVLAGFGAAGLLLRPWLGGGAVLAAAAAAGGLAFERLAVAPLWDALARFGSEPALTLESCLADEVRAVTRFDDRGHGLVAVELDGQLLQLLGTLTAADRAAGVRVRAGDRLRVEDVDAARNRCTVSAIHA